MRCSRWKIIGIVFLALSLFFQVGLVFVSNTSAASSDSLTLRVTCDGIPPASIMDLVASPGINVGEIALAWTTPGDNGWVGPLPSYPYKVKYDTRSVAELGGTTTSWWNLAANEWPQGWSALDPGEWDDDPTLHYLAGLTPGITYYIAIRAIDKVGNEALNNNVASAMPREDDTTPPAAVTDLVATPGVGNDRIDLSWTAPGDDGWQGMATKYIIKYATYNINAGNFQSIMDVKERSVTVSGGGPDSETITGLTTDTTYYFAIKTEDEVPNVSDISNIATARIEDDTTPPAAITDLVATPEVENDRIDLSWTAPGDDGGQGMATKYIIKYATYNINAGNFESITDVKERNVTVSGGGPDSETITGLASDTLYYFAIKTEDEVPNVSDISNIATAEIGEDNLPPREPAGIKGILSADRKTISISWSVVSKNEDGTPCEDLAGYNIYRASFLDGEYILEDFVAEGESLVWVDQDDVKGQTFYYMVKAKDTSGNVSSRISMIADSSKDMNIIAVNSEDMLTHIVIPKEISQILYKETNSYGDDVIIEVLRNGEEENVPELFNGRVIKSYSFIARRGESREKIRDFVFVGPLAKIVLTYEVENGHVKGASSVPENRASEQLALFWFNGLEWIKLGGKVDESLRFVSINSKRIGKLMIKMSFQATSFGIESIQPDKIFTPNGDGWNDYFEIQYANPKDGFVSGKIYDLRGALVAEMEKEASEETLRWDGKDANGNPAPGGVYIYQIEVTGPEEKVINGTVVVAR